MVKVGTLLMGSPHIGFQAPVQDQEGQNGRAWGADVCFICSQENGQWKWRLIDLYLYLQRGANETLRDG